MDCKIENIKIEHDSEMDKIPATATHLNINVKNTIEFFVTKLPPNILSLDTNVSFPHANTKNITSLSISKHLVESTLIVQQYRLPESLTSLKIICEGDETLQYLPPYLPPNLTKIKIVGEQLYFYTEKSFPPSLTSLKNFIMHDLSFIPPNLKKFTGAIVCNKFSNIKLPSTLLHLDVFIHCDTKPLVPLQLPPNLIFLKYQIDKRLEYPCETIIPFYSLPSSLKYLHHSDPFNLPLDKTVPPSIVSLSLGNSFNQPLTSLPLSLRTLKFGKSFDQNVDSLPHSITKLNLGKNFDQPINSLPPSLRSLSLGIFFDHPLDKLPKSLSSLTVYGNDYDLQHLTHLSSLKLKKGMIEKIPRGVPIICDHFNFDVPSSIGHFIPFLTFRGKTYRPVVTVYIIFLLLLIIINLLLLIVLFIIIIISF